MPGTQPIASADFAGLRKLRPAKPLSLSLALTRMIDKLQGIAKAIQILRLPSIAVGLISLASMVVIMFISESHESDRFLIPNIVGLLWAISAYSFIMTFRSVPVAVMFVTYRMVSIWLRDYGG